MRNLLKKLIPAYWQHLYRKWRYGIADHANPEENLQDKFTHIFDTHYWQSQQSVSGKGSDLVQTQTLIKNLSQFLKTYQIKFVLDLPCGDFHWMQQVDLSEVQYIGGDIVPALISQNRIKFQVRQNVEFQVLDLIKDPLPQVDLVLCRDCFIHLSYAHIEQALANIQKSGSRYLLTTTYTHYKLNYNVPSGSWRPLNLQQAPFSFPEPIAIINENNTEEGGLYKDKSLALWEIKHLNFEMTN